MNRGILKYKTLDAAAPQFLQKLSDGATHTGSAVISDQSGLTITESGVGTGLEVLGVFRNAELTQSAGTYGGDVFQPDPTLPIGDNALFLQMTINHTECKYLVPFNYKIVAGPGTWLGGISTDWNLPANWSDGVVPGSTTDVSIPENSPNQPVINSPDATAHDILIGIGASLTLAEFASIEIKGNVTNSGLFNAGAGGAFAYFSGTDQQTIPGGEYYVLSIGGANKILTGNATVSAYLNFSGTAKIALGNSNLTLADGITMSGAGAGTYFITNGTGGLKKNNVGFDEFTFPVGTETSYTPVVFANQGSADNFTVRVGEGAFSSYLDNNPQGSPVSSMVVNKTWYISEDVPGGSSAILQLYWNATDELSSFDRNLCFISHYKSTGWDPTAASQAFGADPYYKRRASITSFSPFVVTNPGSPLPVTLTRFDAAREGSTALLSWSTSSETNSDRFEIERSVNGKDWLQIGSVRSHGESKELVDYQFADLNPIFSAENLYRLRMVDRSAIGTDATFAYSRIRSLNFKDFDRRIVYPNPANDQLFINDPGHVSHVRILDLKGKAVLDFGKIDGHGIRVNQLTPGIHVVEVDWFDGSKTTQKVLINR
ncbi:Por secretion system C-terminal sorting domain-containing protein [Dyadobacter sp. SG02]|uniref:T9SS type A sorting domain-containing protein n=1 Tax=Dyadobacter sp. SG02 TaxID=1855291 RepID=UPI0008D07A3C|nr:T9SS type A sorting domain-containing protein [Dyadobacter sp. SG02]SEI83874.1 Por secretion system C-terminal sorting domain-containing protein [Dyadobacter sp. SG02]